jgi:hypothetical protein
MIFPAIVEECDSAIDGFRNNSRCGLGIRRVAQVMPSESEG